MAVSFASPKPSYGSNAFPECPSPPRKHKPRMTFDGRHVTMPPPYFPISHSIVGDDASSPRLIASKSDDPATIVRGPAASFSLQRRRRDPGGVCHRGLSHAAILH
ncbi:hypothetical protein ACHAXT_009288 [Thalassiosira profunda]